MRRLPGARARAGAAAGDPGAGSDAAQSLLRSTEPFGRLRSQVHRYRGVPLVVTFAPDYLLRHPEDKAGAWEDLCLALETVKDSSPR